MSQFTTKADFRSAYDTLHTTFKTGKTKDVRWRKWQLKQMFWMLDENEDAIIRALQEDLSRTPLSTVLADVNGVKGDIFTNLNSVDKWAAGEAPEGAGWIMGYLGGAWLRKEPLGVCLIVGTWNFPIYTILDPAVNAIAAGNCVLLKPSESTSATQDLLVRLIPKYMDDSAIRLVTGGPEQMTHILTFKFDHIFYTGGGKVGRIIATAAAKHLTPCVLELGGQAPAIVTKTANIDLAAKRIAITKLTNSGQVCLNINHVFADPAIHDALVTKMKEYLTEWMKHREIATIVTPNHWSRIHNLLKTSRGTTEYTGPHDQQKKLIYPTIMTDVDATDSLMSEELFAPLIPVLKADVDTAIKTVSSMPHPLGIYIFSGDKKEIDHILNSTNSGGVTVNDTLLHAVVPNAPFGGVGESGYGAYRGKPGFNSFSHTRSVVGLPDWMDMLMGWRYGEEKLENRKYTDVTPNFKKGETLEDQKLAGGFLGLW